MAYLKPIARPRTRSIHGHSATETPSPSARPPTPGRCRPRGRQAKWTDGKATQRDPPIAMLPSHNAFRRARAHRTGSSRAEWTSGHPAMVRRLVFPAEHHADVPGTRGTPARASPADALVQMAFWQIDRCPRRAGLVREAVHHSAAVGPHALGGPLSWPLTVRSMTA